MFRKHNQDLHKQAKVYKNTRRHQHDGGRAWINDSQLYDAIKNANPKLETTVKELAK